MIDATVAQLRRTTNVSRPTASIGRMNAICRRLVLSRLESIRGGEITIHDPEATYRAGAWDDSRERLSVHIDINDPAFYRSVVTGGSIGAAESYIRGEWSCDDLTALLRIFVRDIQAADEMEGRFTKLTEPLRRAQHWLRRNTKIGSRRNIEAHYDLGNDLFALFLDETMTYSCGVFERADATMREASVTKLDTLCRKLDLQPDDHLLEIGTGWGSLAIHAARNYGCRVTTTTISNEQRDLAIERIRETGLEDRITVELADYRDLEGQYDKLVSIEMIEAVGHKFLGDYFEKCSSLLKDDGLMALQAITMPNQRYDRYRRSVDFIQKYVFPGSCVPSIKAMVDAMTRRSDFMLVDLEDIGLHYATTLRHWRSDFFERLDDVCALGYSEEFIRLWNYYLCYCEAGFAERYISDVHLVLAKPRSRWTPVPRATRAHS